MLRKVRAAYHAVHVALDPTRLDHVFELSNTMRSDAAAQYLVDLFGRTEQGRAALEARPRIGPIDMTALRGLPADTLGRAYAEYFTTNGIAPETFQDLEDRTPEEFVYAHVYEAHDVWHVLAGFDTKLAGELGVLSFTLAQLQSKPTAVLLASGLAHTAFKSFREHRAVMDAIVRGWSLGRSCEPLAGVDWRAQFGDRLSDVRARVGLLS